MANTVTARNFKRLAGTVYVVKHANGDRAEGVFKTVSAAVKLLNVARSAGYNVEIRIGRFVSDDTIELL